MYKVVVVALLFFAAANAMPTNVDELAQAPVSSVLQTSQDVAEQEPKIAAIADADVELSEQNKEALENAETFGFGYYKSFYPRVYVPSYRIYPRYEYYAYPTFSHSLHYY